MKLGNAGVNKNGSKAVLEIIHIDHNLDSLESPKSVLIRLNELVQILKPIGFAFTKFVSNPTEQAEQIYLFIWRRALLFAGLWEVQQIGGTAQMKRVATTPSVC